MRKTLRLKITLPLITLVVVTQLVSGHFIVSRVGHAMHHENHRSGLTVANDLARASARALVSQDLSELRTFVQYAMAQEYVTTAMVIDPECRIVMHSNLARIGETYQAPCPRGQSRFGDHYTDANGDPVVDIRVPVTVGESELGTAVITYSHVGIRREINALRQNIFFILVIGCLVATLFAILLTEYITRPLKHLSHAAEELGSGRFAIKQMATEYSDELGELAKSFYEMATNLEKEICHDTLTGLYTRNVFQMRLVEAGAQAQRHDSPLAVLMLDVDHFKRVNDIHGHSAGDEVLRQVAALLTAQTRAADCVARYGGEEFVVLLPDSSRQGALQVAEKIRRSVELHPFRLEVGVVLSLTISVGVAVLPEDTPNQDWLVELADQALYEAKKGGRNQVVEAAKLLKKTLPA